MHANILVNAGLAVMLLALAIFMLIYFPVSMECGKIHAGNQTEAARCIAETIKKIVPFT
jgi:hypothetical protein